VRRERKYPKFSVSERVSESVDYKQEKWKETRNCNFEFWALHQEF
jgi:hypothetical protein